MRFVIVIPFVLLLPGAPGWAEIDETAVRERAEALDVLQILTAVMRGRGLDVQAYQVVLLEAGRIVGSSSRT